MPMDRFHQLLGLATRAGMLKSGEFAVEQSIKKNEAFLVIIAEDASDNTKKHFHDMCVYRGIQMMVTSDKQKLGRYTGKQERASVCVLDRGFAEKLISIKREGLI